MRIRSLPAALAIVLVAAIALSGCVPSGDRQISAKDAALSTEFPDLTTTAAEAGRAAIELMADDYLMLRPAELTAAGPIPPDGLTLQVTLPAALPEGVQARFAYYDDELGVWEPVETSVDGTRATAVVTHLSLWSIVITGAGELLGTVAKSFEAAGSAMTEFAGAVGAAVATGLKEWSVNGPGAWIYRQAGLLLGMQAAAPRCEAGPLPGWVESTGTSFLTGIPAESQSVLRCLGPDPRDPELVQVKATANRAYGFPIEFAPGVVPIDMTWSVIEDMHLSDLDDLFGFLMDGTPSWLKQNPRDFLSGTSQITFSVSEAEVRSVGEGQHLVSFPKASPPQAALSVVYKYLFDQAIDAVPSMVGVALALRECSGLALPPDAGAAEWLGYLLGCVAKIGDEKFQQKVVTFLAEHPPAEAKPGPLAKLAGKDGTRLVRKVLSVLKWADAVALGLTLVDYLGERDDLTWSVDITAVARAVWEDLNGTWCDSGNPSHCWRISLPTDGDGHPVRLDDVWDGCFVGSVHYESPPPEGFFFCPAGVPSLDRGGQPRDNPAFDRMWRGPGIEPSTWFRAEELAAATGR